METMDALTSIALCRNVIALAFSWRFESFGVHHGTHGLKIKLAVMGKYLSFVPN